MALVCDIKSTPSSQNSSSEKPPEDIEDGEITDDDEEPIPPEPTTAEPTSTPLPLTAGALPTVPVIKKLHGNASDSDSIGAPTRDARERSSDRDRFSDDKERFSEGRDKKSRDRDSRRSKDKGRVEKGHKHMTEAERSILHLRKREKMMREREKWEKQSRKEPEPVDDDFAKTIEKTLATILNKKEKEAAALSGGEDLPQPPMAPKDEEKRGKKRKKDDRDKDRSKGKHRRVVDSPRSEIDENEMLNIRSGSPGAEMRLHPQAPPYGPHVDHRRSRSPSRSEESFHSEYSSDERNERSRRKSIKNRKKKENRERRRERDQRRMNRDEQSKVPLQDSQGVCVFYMQGKCQKNDCPYSHEVSPPMKLELCKFYLMDCCAKGENCSYMHSEFPCKFYHTGLKCVAGEDCKFAHGPALSEGLKQILFKHIETAPRDILQGFPRLSRDEALNLINQSQKKLHEQFSGDATQTSTYVGPTSTPQFGQQQAVGPGIYREEPNENNGEREKEATKGGIPSLFDISVPVPRELAEGLDFELKVPKDRSRNKQSRWQQEQEANMAAGFPMKSFAYGTDQDMRINSNGDIDMRTLPAIAAPTGNLGLNPALQDKSNSLDARDSHQDVDIRSTNVLPFTKDVDIRQAPMTRYVPPSMDTDIRQIPKAFEEKPQSQTDTEDELHIDTGDDKKESGGVSQNFELPQATRDLLARITANQKDNTVNVQNTLQSQPTSQSSNYENDEQNINWYSESDDDDENRLTIKVEEEEGGRRERNDSIDSSSALERDGASQDIESLNSSFLSPPEFNTKTADIVGKLGDLSKIDISAEVTKLLTSMSQNKNSVPSSTGGSSPSTKPEGGYSPRASVPLQDPRMSRSDPRSANQTPSSQEQTLSRQESRPDPRQDPRLTDPRHRSRQSSVDSQEKVKKPEKMSIYEQGGLDMKKAALEIEGDEYKSSLRPDVDLRNMSLPFKGMQNYTPATEIDASINSHLPMPWKVAVVEIPRPDYTGLKLSISDAEKTGDPRLRKIFRLSVDEKDSPASPKTSPKQSSGTRVDPRLRKLEEKSQDAQQSQQMSYTQQVSMLQSSQFYQSLTSNQKLLLNQELARCDQSGGGGMNDPVLNNLLSNLNLLPQTVTSQPGPTHGGDVLSILANITKMNPLMPNQPLMGQQGLLGAAPGIPHIPSSVAQGMPQDYPINFDPRNGGLLGNAPPGSYNQFGGMDQQFGGYGDDFYGGYDDTGNMGPQGGNMGPQGGNMGHPGGNMGPQGGNFRQGRGYNNNNRDGRRRGNRDGFRGGRGNRNFKRGGGGGRDMRGDRGDRGDRDRDRDGGRGNRGHSPA